MNTRASPYLTRGFTLIELLVVIAIIGILSAVVLASLNTARGKANDAQRLTNIRSVQQALELYASDNDGKYPTTANTWYSHCTAFGGYAVDSAIPGLVPKYIGSLPSDSQQNDTAVACCYMYLSNATDYKYIFYNCAASKACYSSTINPGYSDPGRPTNACGVYTPGAALW